MALNDERIITLNCGLGRDSLTLLVLCFEGRLEVEGLGIVRPEDLDAVVFSNTGAEWPHTYDLVKRVRAMCDNHGVRFVVLEKGDCETDMEVSSVEDIEAKAALGGHHRRPAIMDDFQSRATVASLGKGDCTDNHKIQPIRRFINDLSIVRFGMNNRVYSNRVKKGERKPHLTIIGIAADETSRLANGGKGPAYVTEAYPLINMGIAKEGEATHLKRWHLNHVRKSGCFMCPYQPPSWFWALSVSEPETYAAVVEYERIALERNPKMAATGNKKAKGVPMTIPEVVAKWRAANPEATVKSVLSKQYSRCTKEAKEQQKAEMAEAEGVDVPVSSLTRNAAA